MATGSGQGRSDRASRIIRATRRTIYRAFLDPEAMISWLPPTGMTGRVYEFYVRKGGAYRLSLTYLESDHSPRGKTSEHTDALRGRLLDLVPDERIVRRVEFESDDPAFAGAMTITWALADVPGGTEVTVLCENVPPSVRPNDHETGLRSTLENLAGFTD